MHDIPAPAEDKGGVPELQLGLPASSAQVLAYHVLPAAEQAAMVLTPQVAAMQQEPVPGAGVVGGSGANLHV